MACQISREPNLLVKAENGNNSLLFSSIYSNPLIGKEDAISAYKNIFSSKFNAGNPTPVKTDSNGEPKLYYLTPTGEVYNNYKESLDNTETGNIQGIVLTSDNIGYTQDSRADIVVTQGGSKIELNATEDAYTPLFTIDSNSNPDTLNGFINQQIRLGYLNDKKRDGALQGAGENEQTSSMLASLVTSTEYIIQRNDNGTLFITEPEEIISEENIAKNLKEGNRNSLVNRLGQTAVVRTAYNIYRKKNSIFRERKNTTEIPATQTNEQLANSLKSFLNKLGVNLTSIEDYVLRYSEKNGIEPSAQALADISNKVIAYANGEISIENLSEETAHFAVEAFQDQELLNRMLQNIHLTNEWQQYAQQYSEVYGKKYSGAELDNIVRREILGKVLSRKFQENFAETQNTPVEAGFTNLLRQLWNDFINSIRSLITPSAVQELNNFTDAIANNVLNEEFDEIFSISQLNKSDFILYSLADKRVSTQLQRYYNSLRKINENFKKRRQQGITLPQMKANEDALDTAEAWIVVQQLNAGLSAPLNKTVRIVEEADKKYQNGDTNQNKLYLDAETIASISSLSEAKSALRDMITVIEVGALREIEQVNKQLILEDLRSKTEQIDYLESRQRFYNLEGSENTVEHIIATSNLAEEDAELIRQQIEQETKDVSWFTLTFGQLRLANNAFLNLLGKIFSDLRTKAVLFTQRDISPMNDFISENNYNIREYNKIVERFKNGKITGNLISEVNLGQFNHELQSERVRVIKDILNLSDELSDKEVLNQIENLSEQQKLTYDQRVEDWIWDNAELQYTPEYYRQRREDTAWMNIATKKIQKSWSQGRYAIYNKYPKVNGIVDLTNLSDADRAELQAISQERKGAKSLTNDDGTTKEEGTEEYIIANDLIRADEEFAEKRKDLVFKLKEQFINNLQQVENEQGNEKALGWVEANGGFRFTQDFYEALSTGEPRVVTNLKSVDLDGEEYDTVEELANDISDKLKRRSDILRKYQKTGNPSEVDTASMSAIAKDTVRQLDVEIQSLFREANQVLKRNGLDEIVPPQVETENTINQSYTEDLINSGVSPSEFNTEVELDFIAEHVSGNDKVEIAKFIKKAQDIRTLSTTNIEPKYKRFFANYYNIDSEIENDEFFDQVRDKLLNEEYQTIEAAYGKTKLFSYYKRFAPKGYSEFLENLQNGKIKPSRLLNDRDALTREYPVVQYVEITPTYTWNEETNVPDSQVNPNYKQNWEGDSYQPKISKYKNAEYDNLNDNQKQMLSLFHEIKRKQALKHKIQPNIYRLPQISKSNLEKIATAANQGIGETLKRGFKDTFMNRIDDMDYGQLDESSSQNVIPVKYVFDLEETSDVSLDLGFTYSELMYEANLYEQKHKALNSVMAIQQSIEQHKFAKGKTGDTSNTLKMAQSFIDYNIYGKTQNRKLEIDVFGFKIDISRLALLLHKYLQFASLAFNPIVAVTNYTTGVLNKSVIEARLGQFLNVNSVAYAEKEFNLKEAPKLTSEVGKMNRTSKVYRVLEAAGVIDFRNRLQGSGFGRVATAFNNIGYEGYLVGDTIIKGKVFIATFDDIRAVPNIGWLRYDQFKLRPENKELTKKQITDKWNEHREKSLWNALDNSGQTIQFKQEFLEEFGQQRMDEIYINTLERAAQTSSTVDGQIPAEEKSLAQRDFLLRFTTGMRGWLFNLLASRLQGRKTLLQSGQNVEGSYITGAKYINNLVKNLIEKKGIMQLMSAVKQEWDGLDDTQKINMRRNMLDFAVFVTMLGLSTLAMAASDDDDSYLEALGGYILLRTTSEQASQSIVGLPGSVMDVMDKPIMAIGFLKDVYNANFFDTLESGKYEGYSEVTALAIKNSFIKQMYNMQDIKKTRDTYRFYSEETLFYLSSNKSTEEFLDKFVAE